MTKNFVKFTEKYKKGSVWGRPNKKIQLQEIKKDIKKLNNKLWQN